MLSWGQALIARKQLHLYWLYLDSACDPRLRCCTDQSNPEVLPRSFAKPMGSEIAAHPASSPNALPSDQQHAGASFAMPQCSTSTGYASQQKNEIASSGQALLAQLNINASSPPTEANVSSDHEVDRVATATSTSLSPDSSVTSGSGASHHPGAPATCNASAAAVLISAPR